VEYLRRALGAVALWVAVTTLVGCADDNARYDELAESAEELGEAIAGTEVTVIAADSSCPVPSSCPDIARVDLPDRSALSQVEIAAIAAELGWDVNVVDDRLFTIANDDDMSGSVSVSSDGRVGLAIGED